MNRIDQKFQTLRAAKQKGFIVYISAGDPNLTATANAIVNTPAEIAAGIEAVCRRVAAASPASRILLMGVLPRAAATDPLRAGVRAINALLSARAAGWPAVPPRAVADTLHDVREDGQSEFEAWDVTEGTA